MEQDDGTRQAARNGPKPMQQKAEEKQEGLITLKEKVDGLIKEVRMIMDRISGDDDT